MDITVGLSGEVQGHDHQKTIEAYAQATIARRVARREESLCEERRLALRRVLPCSAYLDPYTACSLAQLGSFISVVSHEFPLTDSPEEIDSEGSPLPRPLTANQSVASQVKIDL